MFNGWSSHQDDNDGLDLIAATTPNRRDSDDFEKIIQQSLAVQVSSRWKTEADRTEFLDKQIQALRKAPALMAASELLNTNPTPTAFTTSPNTTTTTSCTTTKTPPSHSRTQTEETVSTYGLCHHTPLVTTKFTRQQEQILRTAYDNIPKKECDVQGTPLKIKSFEDAFVKIGGGIFTSIVEIQDLSYSSFLKIANDIKQSVRGHSFLISSNTSNQTKAYEKRRRLKKTQTKIQKDLALALEAKRKRILDQERSKQRHREEYLLAQTLMEQQEKQSAAQHKITYIPKPKCSKGIAVVRSPKNTNKKKTVTVSINGNRNYRNNNISFALYCQNLQTKRRLEEREEGKSTNMISATSNKKKNIPTRPKSSSSSSSSSSWRRQHRQKENPLSRRSTSVLGGGRSRMKKKSGKNRWTSSRGGGSRDQVVFYKKHVIPKDLMTRARR